jgi:hypothetical protein
MRDVVTAYDLVQRLRPQFLRGRGVSTGANGQATGPVIYLDNVLFGPTDALRQIRAENVKEIRYLNASDATTRWGTNHDSGVIMVTSRHG